MFAVYGGGGETLSQFLTRGCSQTEVYDCLLMSPVPVSISVWQRMKWAQPCPTSPTYNVSS